MNSDITNQKYQSDYITLYYYFIPLYTTIITLYTNRVSLYTLLIIV